MHESLTLPNHEAMPEVSLLIDQFNTDNELGESVKLHANERFNQAVLSLEEICGVVGETELDSAVAEFVEHVEQSSDDPTEIAKAVSLGVQEVYVHPNYSALTAHELHQAPTQELGDALRDVAIVEGDDAVKEIMEHIEDAGSGIAEFDALDDYSPEFSGQVLLHRSNGELNPGDIILPSDQISADMHQRLNAKRSFSSSSAPGGAGGYDKQLAHAGTRDYGETYGEYLYIVEPIDGDTLKWGENFGMPNFRHMRAESPAINRSSVGKADLTAVDPSGGKFAKTDSFTGKQYNEVVSTQGFKVVKRIAHEPDYEESMLPWPVSANALDTHTERRKNSKVGVMHDAGHVITEVVNVNSRKRASKIGAKDYPGTYRAGATDQIAANLQNKFDLRKQQAENPGQMPLPEMPRAKFRMKHEVPSGEVQPYRSGPEDQQDTPLPGLEDTSPKRPMI